MKRKAFTVVELMVALTILTLLVTVLWKVFSSTQKNAKVITENHFLNDELDRKLIKITADIREANSIASEAPKIYELSEIAALKTENPDNLLSFRKINFHFDKNPADLAEGEKNYDINEIHYYVQKDTDDEGKETGKWNLMREMIYLDSEGKPDDSKQKEYETIRGLDECIFYRVNDPNVPRTGNIYIKLKINGEKGNKYTSESIISVKERSAMP